MVKGLRLILALFLIVIFINPSFSQVDETKTWDPATGARYKYLPNVRRLSYENFRNIKLLNTAIVNYGRGKPQVKKLIEEYSDATALYFQNKIKEANDKFLENKKNIFLTSIELAGVYKKEANEFIPFSVKFYTSNKMARAILGEKENLALSKLIRNGMSGVKRANIILDDYKYIKPDKLKAYQTPSPRKLIRSIYYFRRARENIFTMYEIMLLDINEINKVIDAKKIDDSKKREEKKKVEDKFYSIDRDRRVAMNNRNFKKISFLIDNNLIGVKNSGKFKSFYNETSISDNKNKYSKIKLKEMEKSN